MQRKKRYFMGMIVSLLSVTALTMTGCDLSDGGETTEPVAEQSTELSQLSEADQAEVQPNGEILHEPEMEQEVSTLHVNQTHPYYDGEWEDTKPIMAASCQGLWVLDPGYESLQTVLDEICEKSVTAVKTTYEENLELARQMTGDEYFEGWTDQVTCKTLRADTAIFSFLVTEYANLGGAHPSTIVTPHNLDPSTGSELKLQDVVTNYDMLYVYVTEQLAKNSAYYGLYDEYSTQVQELFYPTSDTDQSVSWYMDRQGLTVYFDTYEIAPYAAGPIRIPVGFEEIPEMVQPEYRIAEQQSITEMTPYASLDVDIDGDGQTNHISYQTIPLGEEEGNYDQIVITVDGQEQTYDLYSTCRTVYLMETEAGDYYIYAAATGENDYQTIDVFALTVEGSTHVDTAAGGFLGSGPLQADNFTMTHKIDVLGSYSGYRDYQIGADGMPEAKETDYHIINFGKDWSSSIVSTSELQVTGMQEMEDGTEALGEQVTLPSGTRYYPVQTDAQTYMEMQLDDGSRCRISLTKQDYEWLLDGVSEYQCFEELPYAG